VTNSFVRVDNWFPIF